MWGSEFFNKTLIILSLLFDVREQLLIRKKKVFYFPKWHMLRKCHITIYFSIRDKILGHSWHVFWFFPYQQSKRKFLKNENRFTYMCQ